MNKIDIPNFFDDHAALDNLTQNAQLNSHPHLQPYLNSLKAGYDQYTAAHGNVLHIANVALPDPIAAHLLKHYGSPPRDLRHIKEMRERSGVNTCPMCGSLHSGTLDHILPKTDFPAFAVFGLNLVPACKCNSFRGKQLTGPNANERILHPYFDDILGQRLLAAEFTDPGAVPSVSVKLLLDAANPHYAAARFHLTNIVERTGIKRYLMNSWAKLIRRPSLVAMELRHTPQSCQELFEILERQRDQFDESHESRNNWNSVFISGLLEDQVLHWICAGLNQPGRAADGPLAARRELKTALQL